jgi:hypothetical protein
MQRDPGEAYRSVSIFGSGFQNRMESCEAVGESMTSYLPDPSRYIRIAVPEERHSSVFCLLIACDTFVKYLTRQVAFSRTEYKFGFLLPAKVLRDEPPKCRTFFKKKSICANNTNSYLFHLPNSSILFLLHPSLRLTIGTLR